MNPAPLDHPQQEASTTARPVQNEAVSGQLVPAKREHNDEVQFISCQPIKKMRLNGDKLGHGDQTTGPRASSPGGKGYAHPPADTSMQERSISAMPLGLPSHLSADPAWENRGVSLPAMENFSFATAHIAASSRPATSTAVSPKQLPTTVSPGVNQGIQAYFGEASLTCGMTIDQVSCLDVREPLDSLNSILATNMSNANNPSSLNTRTNVNMIGVNTMVPTRLSASMASFRAPEPASAGNSTLNTGYTPPGYIPVHTQTPIPSTLHSMGNQVPLRQPSASVPASVMPTTTSQGLANSEALPRQTTWTGESANTLVPDWSQSPVNHPVLQHPRPVRTPDMSLSSAISAWNQSSLQPTLPQRRGCPACLAVRAAREQRLRAPSHGHSHGGYFHGNPPPTPPEVPSWPRAFVQSQVPPPTFSATNRSSLQNNLQSSAGASSLSSPAYTYPQALTANPGARNISQAGNLPQSGPGPFTMLGSASAPAHSHSGIGSSLGYGHLPNTLNPIPRPIITHTQNVNETSLNRSAFPVLPSTAFQPTPTVPQDTSVSNKTTQKPAQIQPQTLPNQTQHQPKPQNQQQHQTRPQEQPTPSAQAPPPSTISAAAEAAATLASKRKKHAANLLVDVAELVADIFPFEIVARQHGTLPRKVAEALAAVVQVPLLRCATDKRRTGKLGSERMKEFREARKGWVAMVKEWEREEEGGEKDAKGEVDAEVVIGNNGAGKGGVGAARETGQVVVDPRAVTQPGEPSALDVALLLAPTEMPAQVLRETFFTGPW